MPQRTAQNMSEIVAFKIGILNPVSRKNRALVVAALLSEKVTRYDLPDKNDFIGKYETFDEISSKHLKKLVNLLPWWIIVGAEVWSL